MDIADLIDAIAHLTGYVVLGGLALYHGLPWLSKHWKEAIGFILFATTYYTIAHYSSEIWAFLLMTCIGVVIVGISLKLKRNQGPETEIERKARLYDEMDKSKKESGGYLQTGRYGNTKNERKV